MRRLDPSGFPIPSAIRVACRFVEAGGRSPMEVGSARLLKKQGLTPADEFFGEIRLRPNRVLVSQGEMVADLDGKAHFFVGVDAQGKAILADTEQELSRGIKKLHQDRLRNQSLSAAWTPPQIQDNNLRTPAPTPVADTASALPGDPEE